MPDAQTELDYGTPYELLVAVILSAQCTDKRVNIITPEFYKSFPTADQLASATQEHVFELIKSCSYPNNKAKNLIGMARVLSGEFKGIVPSDIDELQKLYFIIDNDNEKIADITKFEVGYTGKKLTILQSVFG